MENVEPDDHESSEWKNWALMQAGPAGRPVYTRTPSGEVVEAAPIELALLLERYGR